MCQFIIQYLFNIFVLEQLKRICWHSPMGIYGSGEPSAPRFLWQEMVAGHGCDSG